MLNFRSVVFVLVGSFCVQTPVFAQGHSTDPRAVEECRRAASDFAKIEECLPQTHISFAVLDAFDATYPEQAIGLRSRCSELNDTVTATRICVTDGIKKAISLSGMLPPGSDLDDPIFNAIKDQALFDHLEAVREEATSLFPDLPIMSGAIMFYPYSAD